MGGDGIGSDDGFRTEQPVDAQQVLRRVVRPGLSKGTEIAVGIEAEGTKQFAAGLVLCHRLVVAQTLQLVECRADEDGDIVADAGESRLERLLQQCLSIGCRSEAPHHRCSRLAGADAGGHRTLTGGIERVVGNLVDVLDMLGVDVQLLQHSLTQFLGHLLGVHIEDGTAHDDGFVEQSLGLRHAKQRAHLATPARFTEDGDIRGVAAKLTDVLLHPLQGLHHVEHAHIAGILVFRATSREIQESEDVQTVVYAHHDDILLGQLHARIPCRGARVKTASMQPHHDGRPLPASPV